MSTVKSTNEQLNTNLPVQLSVTLQLPPTFPTSNYQMAFSLNVKDTSPQEIEEKCYKLHAIIQTWIYGLFFKELTTGSRNRQTP